jgi:FkbM family methyltransferase
VKSFRHRAGRALDRLLEPLGIEIKRRVGAGPRRSTLSSALRRLKALGFSPQTVIDVGVATGTPALYDTFPEARHVLVEPLAEFKGDLDRIVAGLPRAEYVLAAASERAGDVKLNITGNAFLTSRHTLRDQPEGVGEQRTVPGVALDDIWRTRQLRGPCILKVDVEGDELAVLEGAHEVLQSCEYLILEVEIREIFIGRPTLDLVARRLAERGFVLDDLLELGYGPTGDLHVLDAAFVPEAGWLWAHTGPKRQVPLRA